MLLCNLAARELQLHFQLQCPPFQVLQQHAQSMGMGMAEVSKKQIIVFWICGRLEGEGSSRRGEKVTPNPPFHWTPHSLPLVQVAPGGCTDEPAVFSTCTDCLACLQDAEFALVYWKILNDDKTRRSWHHFLFSHSTFKRRALIHPATY